jgi:hypothetical protein
MYPTVHLEPETRPAEWEESTDTLKLCSPEEFLRCCTERAGEVTELGAWTERETMTISKDSVSQIIKFRGWGPRNLSHRCFEGRNHVALSGFLFSFNSMTKYTLFILIIYLFH